MYKTIIEQIEEVGQGGEFRIGWNTYRVSVYTVFDIALDICDGEYAGMRLWVEFDGDKTRAYMYPACEICGSGTRLRWSFASGDIVRKVSFCLTCYNRYQKRKALLYQREPVYGRNIIQQSRLPQLEVVRIVTGDERGVIRPMWWSAF